MDKDSKDFTPREMMIVTAAREIEDREIVLVGTYWPILAVILAKKTHAPKITIVVEGGVVRDSAPLRIPLVASDPCMVSGASLCGDSFDTLGMILHAGRTDVGFLSAAIIDKYGNINTTCVGDYLKPKVRLSGSGGACDFGCLAKRLIIMLEHDKRRFPERVDYITTPGYLDGADSRESKGLMPDSGPSAVVTTLGLFRFEENTKEMYLDRYYPGITANEIKASVGWDLKVAEEVKEAEPPTDEEIRILRQEVDPQGMFLRDVRKEFEGR